MVFTYAECHMSCKLTCDGPDGSDCEDCRVGWQLSDSGGCFG